MSSSDEEKFFFFSKNYQFHQSVVQFLQQVKDKSKWNLKNILRFPFTEFITDGDLFFKRIWQMIDHSKNYFWITTYAIDSSLAANTTLYKLIQALQRGVHVVLFVDNVQYWAKDQLIKQFQAHGGTFRILNPQWKLESIKKYFTRQVWRRHHEKLIVSDNKALIGSANIEESYAGIKYGTSTFKDLNYYTENIILDQYRKHFTDVAKFYSFQLQHNKSNQQLLQTLNQLFPNSQFYKTDKYGLLHNDLPTNRREIENYVISHMRKAQKDIKIIQPYYYTMRKFDSEMQKTTKRGVKAQIITAGKRDQPAYQSIFNYMLFENLIKKKVEVYEITQKLLHSKLYLFDSKWMTLGSMNNDRWSWKINNQLNVWIHDERQCEYALWYFNQLFKRTKKVVKQLKIQSSRAQKILFWQKFMYLSESVMSTYGNPDQFYFDESDEQNSLFETHQTI